MRRQFCLILAISIGLAFSNGWVLAGEPQKKQPEGEKIPAPKQKINPPQIIPQQDMPQQIIPWQIMPQQIMPQQIVIPMRPRPGTREVWQNYAVDNFGQFRPRVILSPYGSYYFYNGQPYPWISNSSTAFMPYVVD